VLIKVPGTEKVMARADRLLYSSYVQEPMDYIKSVRYYFVKAFVRASMEAKKYLVHVLCVVSGTVLYAQCDECKQSALGRCSHVGALLKYMSEHVQTKGYDRKLILVIYDFLFLLKCALLQVCSKGLHGGNENISSFPHDGFGLSDGPQIGMRFSFLTYFSVRRMNEVIVEYILYDIHRTE